MIKIDLKYNNAYKWKSDEEIYFIGYIYYNEKFYANDDALKLIKSQKEIGSFLEEIDGCFSIVLNKKNKIIIISDLLRTFPVFYKVTNEDIFIIDNIMNFSEKILKEDNVEELDSCGYVTGSDTIFEEINQVQGHEIVYINKNTKEVEKNKYWNYEYRIQHKKKKDLIKELDDLYDKATKKMIKYLEGRKAVIPLSGGNDSRQLAYYLKRNGYSNILTYTYGSSYSEIETSRKVAEFLGLDWKFIEYKNKSMQRKFNNKEKYSNMANYCGRGFSTPIIQEWEAISKLIEDKIIVPSESVIISGYSGDFIAGSHIKELLYEKEKITWNELKKYIFKYQNQYSNIPYENSIVKEKWNKNFEKFQDNEVIKKEEAIELFERYDFEERQTKYITNAIRTYDYQGLEWYLLFWDKSVIEKWLQIPIEQRYKISLFKDYTEKIYKDLMEYAPVFKIDEKGEIKPPFKFIKKIYRLIDIYRNGFLNFYGYFYFRTYLKYFIETKNYKYNKMFIRHYIHYLKNTLKEEKK